MFLAAPPLEEEAEDNDEVVGDPHTPPSRPSRSRREVVQFEAEEIVRASYEGIEYDAKIVSKINFDTYSVLFSSWEGEWTRPCHRDKIKKKDSTLSQTRAHR